MIRTAILWAALATLAGCVSVLPKSDPPEAYYRIGPVPTEHRLAATVTVREPEASRLFSGRTLAAEDAAGGLRIVRGVQWADNATEMMQTALLDALSGEGEFAAMPSSAAGPSDYELNWRLSDFTLFEETARCRIDATLLEGRSRRVVAQKTLRTTAVSLDESNASRAKSLTDAGRACISELAAFVVEVTTPEE